MILLLKKNHSYPVIHSAPSTLGYTTNKMALKDAGKERTPRHLPSHKVSEHLWGKTSSLQHNMMAR